MAEVGVTEKLVAVLVADVAGYSRLMQDDAQATVVQLEACRAIFREHVAAQGGRVVDTAGDSVLAVFERATGALRAAIDVQDALAAHNASLPDDRHMRFRIGLHIGEVLHQSDGTIYGDGVNIAARLQTIAGAGGICVSDLVRGAVAGRVDTTFVDIGPQTVKNIDQPVHAYSVGEPAEAARSLGKARRVSALVVSALTIVAAVAVGFWFVLDDAPTASAGGASIAVLPFANMSGDAAQDYFADGISEDLVTELSRFEGLLVIASNSAFRFKGADANHVADALGVRYVLEGGVRREGERVRITAQLIDSKTGGHLWAERYDRDVTDVFAVQDEVTEQIIAALTEEIGALAPTRATKPMTANPQAYDLFLRARVERQRRTPEASERAYDFLTKAIEIDPSFAAAYAEISDVQNLADFYGWDVAHANHDDAVRNAEKAVALDDKLPLALTQLGRRQFERQLFDQSEATLNMAVALDSNYAAGYSALAALYAYRADYDLALAMADKAISLDPYAVRPLLYKGMAAFAQDDYAGTVTFLEALVARNPDFGGAYLFLAAAHAHLGNMPAAKKAAADVLRVSPGFENGLARFWFVDRTVVARLIDGLRRAGLEVSDLEATD